MDAAELRATQAPIKERYKSDPKAAMIKLTARGSIENEGIACKVETGRALAVAGLHPATGGSGMELCSGDMLLEALVACAGVTPLRAARQSWTRGPTVMSKAPSCTSALPSSARERGRPSRLASPVLARSRPNARRRRRSSLSSMPHDSAATSDSERISW